MKLNSILDQIDLGNYALPEFQRGFVWNRDQVRKLMYSLYKGYPIGSLLVWVTETDPEITRGDKSLTHGSFHLILDGQQRVTSLYGIIRGQAPPFFDGDSRVFTGLYFHVMEEIFEFYLSSKMDNDPNWVNVTDVMTKGLGAYIPSRPDLSPPELQEYLDRLNTLSNIKEIDIPIQEVTGADKTVDVVVDIFNNVNSGGTKLSKGDLALAKLCAQWSDARQELRDILTEFDELGFCFKMDWLLRCLTVYLTGQPYFSGLSQVSISDFKKAIPETRKMIGTILDQIGSRLGLDHDRVLQSKFAFPTIIQIMKISDSRHMDNREWNKILFWYVHTFLWGRYSGSTESKLAQDLNTLEDGGNIDGLIDTLRRSRGDLLVRPADFIGWSRGSRFYPLLYMMTRVSHSIDWISGLELSNSLLGRNSSLEVHHVFPKNQLYKHEYSRPEVNALSNFTFLTKDTNIQISNMLPEDYLPLVQERQPNALLTHWIPDDPDLWKMENYPSFIEERRKLLAKAANDILDNLFASNLEGPIVTSKFDDSSTHFHPQRPSVEEYLDDEEEALLEVVIWMEEHGLDCGELDFELTDDTDTLLATVDLAWPEGIQIGLTEPVALLLNEPPEVWQAVSQAGYIYFTDIAAFKEYVESKHLAKI